VIRSHTITYKETLIELAVKYDVGYNEIIAANKKIDAWIPEKGTSIIIPTSWLLPEVTDNGIIINLAEMRLYYFLKIDNNQYVTTFPIGIGRQGFTTPAGSFEITARVQNPIWTVPEDVRNKNPELPSIVPPGPHNPLGKYWLQLSVNGYGIHGTNRKYGIGRKVSHGCIRLYPDDIETLYKFTKIGTPVKIINEPIKVGTYEDKVYLEVHSSDMNESELLNLAVLKLSKQRLLKYTDTSLMFDALRKSTGLPAMISK
jgi:L,D-transpeptidase ErfK/SrfK